MHRDNAQTKLFSVALSLGDRVDDNSMRMDNELLKLAAQSPRAYMQKRRPNLFSDSKVTTDSKLEKDYLEYKLETLTNRKEEQCFEEFCRRLCEVEICPNIKPQTGPTGGGDSKTDGSTYPISDALALRAYFGSPTNATSAQWAFAFSCKKKWMQKAQDDLEKIRDLNKGFTHAYFITNQFVSDKKRADMEERLSKLTKMTITILDRTWIVSRVVDHKRQKIAIETLGLDDRFEKAVILGPNDTERSQLLEKLLERLRVPADYLGNDYALSMDYRLAAEHSRGLEKPRHETEGLYRRALDIAKRSMNSSLVLNIGYDYIWTMQWWFEDFQMVFDIYTEIEPHFLKSDGPDDCESMMNLYRLLQGGVSRGKLDSKIVNLPERERIITDKLKIIQSRKGQPNAALHAEVISHIFRLNPTIRSDEAVEIFANLKHCVKASIRLGQFPMMELINNLSHIGLLYGNLSGYDDLLEYIIKVTEKRTGETASANLQYERGRQLLANDERIDALKYLSNAEMKFLKEETTDQWMNASLSSGCAYEELGLLWAARSQYLMVAHRVFRKMENVFEFSHQGFFAAFRLASIELSLFRVRPFLKWIRYVHMVIFHHRSTNRDIDDAVKRATALDMRLGATLLKTNEELLRSLPTPEYIRAHHCELSYLAHLFALKRHHEIPDEYAKEDFKFFREWKDQLSASSNIGAPQDICSGWVVLRSRLFSINFMIRCQNCSEAIFIGENLLATFEAALVQARWEHLAFMANNVQITVTMDGEGCNPPAIVDDAMAVEPIYECIWNTNFSNWIHGNEARYREWITTFLFRVLFDITMDPISRLKKELDKLRSTGCLMRSFMFSPAYVYMQDLTNGEGYDISEK
jgi:hypothetical protein